MIELNKESRAVRWSLSIFGTVLLFFLWYLTTDVLALFNIAGFTSPMAVFTRFMETRGVIISNIWPTFKVAIVGFILAITLGILVAVLLTSNERIRNALFPLIVGGNSVPRISLAPVLIFYIGGFQAKYLITTWIAFFPFTVNTMEGLANLNEDIELLLESIDATFIQEFKYVRFPNSLPFIFDGMKIAVPTSIVGAVVSEYVASNSGLGFLSLFALTNLDIELAFATVMIAGFISLLAFYSLFLVQNRIIHWKKTQLFTE